MCCVRPLGSLVRCCLHQRLVSSLFRPPHHPAVVLLCQSRLPLPARLHTDLHRCAAAQQKEDKSVAHRAAGGVGQAKPLDFKEKVKENTKTTVYGSIIVLGIGVTGIMMFTILRELFGKKSPNSVYSRSLDLCAADTRVLDVLGAPVKGHGEENRRGRRRHVDHVKYEKNGVNHMRMKFYIKGSRQSGTVYLDVRESAETGDYEYRYLFVEVDDFTRRVIVLEDNRGSEPSPSLPPLPPLKDYSQS